MSARLTMGRPAVSIALFHGKGEETRTLLVRRGPGSVLEGTLAFPGGGLEDGESPRGAASRELEEETGLRLPPELLQEAERFEMEGFVPDPISLQVFRGYLDSVDPPSPLAASDASEARWFPVHELLAAWSSGALPLTDTVRQILESVTAPVAAAGIPADRSELRRGVLLHALPAPTLPPATHTNAYLLGTGDERILVDPGADDEAQARPLLELLDTLAGQGIRLREVWLSHHHRDHHASLPFLRARQELRCRAHPLTARALPQGVVDAPLHDGEEVHLSGPLPQTWSVIAAPGHSADHTVFFEQASGTLLCGDHIAGVGTVIVDPPDGDMGDYLKTLDRLEALGANLLLPGHGPPTTLVAERIQTYRAHRLEREAAILAALGAGHGTLASIVREVYTDVPTDLHPFAERSVLAHLLKLELERRAHRSNERWQRSEPS